MKSKNDQNYSSNKKQKLFIELIDITILPNDIIRYILREFLKPFAIRNCFLAHRVFWVMTRSDMQLIKQLTTVSFVDCILLKEPKLCYSMYKYNQICNVPMLVLRPDFLLIQCCNRNNNDKIEIASFLLKRVELKKLKPHMMDNCLTYIFQNTASYDNAKIFEMIIEKLQNENIVIGAIVFPCLFKSIGLVMNLILHPIPHPNPHINQLLNQPQQIHSLTLGINVLKNKLLI